jgi:acyl-CoA synthetase (NDP forming)
MAALPRPAPTEATYPPIDLRPLFAPRSIAVVGASPRNNIAQTVRDNLVGMGSPTTCHFVNPRYSEAWGSPCVPSLDELGERPDLVVAAVGVGRIATVIDDAARLGVPAAVIPGGGVVEGGEEAAAMQRTVRDIALANGMAVLGPNCMGVVDFAANSAAYIGDLNPWLPRGGIAGIAQSGSVTDAFIHAGNRVGFSRIVSSGAEIVLDLCDYLAWSIDDPATHGIILFVEGFRRPERFLALADRALEVGKPILAVKVGRTDHSREAALAHSGTLAGEDRIVDAAFEAAGVIRCPDLDALLEAAELLEGCRRTGRSVGRGRTGVVTVSTGEAGLIADTAPDVGLDLPPVPPSARARILDALPTMGFVANPLDPWGAADAPTAYGIAFEALAASGAYDVLVAVHDFPYRSLVNEVEVAADVTRALLGSTASRPDLLPVYVSLTSGEPTPEIKALLDDAGGAPLLRGTSEAFGAIAALARWQGARNARSEDGPRRADWPALALDRTPAGHDPVDPGLSGARTVLAERDSLIALRMAGLPVIEARAVRTPGEAVAAADELGYPVAVKLDVDALAHKSAVGGVILGLADPEEVVAAAARLLAVGVDGARGLLVEPMAPPGLELIVGLRRDPLFGPAVLVGLGGILAETLDDVAVALAPLTGSAATALLARLRGAPLLARHGDPATAVRSVADVVARLSLLGVERPDIVELDLNPIVLSSTGVVAVDALMVLDA